MEENLVINRQPRKFRDNSANGPNQLLPVQPPRGISIYGLRLGDMEREAFKNQGILQMLREKMYYDNNNVHSKHHQ